MFKKWFKFLAVFIIFLHILIPLKVRAQLIIGQYKDEAPLRTWNIFGLATGGSLSMGGAHYAHAFDLSSSLTNPSQLSRLPKFTAVLNGSLTIASLFKYSLVNTGPVRTNGNSLLTLYSLDFGGISLNLNGWGVSINTSILENYDRPPASYQYKERDSVVYQLDFEQTGLLRNTNLSLSKNLGNQILFGLGINLVSGEINKALNENFNQSIIIITDKKSHKLKGFYLNGGLTFFVSEDFQVAAVFRTPYKKNSDSHSILRYEAAPVETDIKITSRDASSFWQPFILGAGINYRFSEKIRVVADATFYNWSKYKANFFGEEKTRNFKNIIHFGTGIEYLNTTKLFGLEFETPIWMGLCYDPQPMKNINSTYYHVTFGTGLIFQNFFLHGGASLGFENGSGDGLRGRRVALTLGYKR